MKLEMTERPEKPRLARPEEGEYIVLARYLMIKVLPQKEREKKRDVQKPVIGFKGP